MDRYALIGVDNFVQSIVLWDGRAAWTPPAGFSAVLGPTAKPGDTFLSASNTFVSPAPPPPAPVDLISYAAAKRWEREVGGILFNDIPVPTDDRAKLLILGAAQCLADDASAPFVSKGRNYGTLTGVQFRELNNAVIMHVQKTFKDLGTVFEGISNGSITKTDQVDSLI